MLKTAKRIKNLKAGTILHKWIVKDMTFAEIGKKLGISKQAAQQKFDRDAEKLYIEEDFQEWFEDIYKDSEGKPYPYMDFENEAHGKFYVYMLRKHFGYHIAGNKHALLEKLNIQKIRVKITALIREGGLPLRIEDHVEGNPFAYNECLHMAKAKAWEEFFVAGETPETKENFIFALRKESMIFNLCKVMKTAVYIKEDPIEVEDAFNIFPQEFKDEKEVGDLKTLSAYLLEKRKYLYMLDEACKNPFIAFAGITRKS